MYDAQKAKGLLIKWNIENFRHRSHNEMFWFKKIKCYDEYEAKWKASKLCYQVLCEVIYVYFYNWDMSHYQVLVVYGLVELIIEASHSSKDYLIVDIHTHHICLCSMNAIFICMIVQKAKGYPIKEKYQKAFSQWDVIVLKNKKDLMMESNVKL